jgi:formate dehydrogenase iron-sulfur subunit
MNNSSNSSAKLYVPRDSAARSVGADEVAEALQLATVDVDFDIDVVRNGSRGMLWLEPLVEVVTPYGRVGYGPVAPADVAGLLAAGMLDGADHPLRLGVVDELPWLARQTRYLYIRSEYPEAVATMRTAIGIARAHGWLGKGILGSTLDFDLHVRVGAGAYICGEETSMLESLEGKRGTVRTKPPIPAIEGLFGKPTVVNNVLTLATVPVVLADGAKAYQELGVERSRGTQVFQLGGNIAHGGIIETAFGVTLRELVEDYGGGTFSGRPVRTVQVGGPLGAYLPTSMFDLPMDYEAFAAAGAMVGHGGLVLFDDSVDMAAQARFAMEFCAEESCGKCTPRRVGSVRGVEVIDKIVAGEHRDENLALLEDLCDLMTDGSLCAMGGLTPMPVRSAITHFPDDFLDRT